MEDVVHDCFALGPDGQPLEAPRVRQLGELLLSAFKLHQRLHHLATTGGKGAKDKKRRGGSSGAGGAAGKAGGEKGEVGPYMLWGVP